MRRLVYQILESQDGDLRLRRVVNVSLLLLIGANVVALTIESMVAEGSRTARILLAFDAFSVIIFSIEYCLRIWSCVEAPVRGRSATKRMRWAKSPFAVIDLAAVLPWYIPFLGIDLRVVRILRVFRVFRVLKLARYSKAIREFGRVAKNKKEELLITLGFAVSLLLVSSVVIYHIERDTVLPSGDRPFRTIPHAMWWATETLTTVGYGDAVPQTIVGKIIGGIVAFLGIGMFALPAGILGSGFLEEVRARRATIKCPHCGRSI